MLSRRQFIEFSLSAAAFATVPGWASATRTGRELGFYHLHTGEKLRISYYENGAYIPSALAAINRVLRDWRTGEVFPIEPKLLDQLYVLQRLVETPGPYHVICGYRSPVTNQMLRGHSNGVAQNSLHLQGQAIDICLPGKSLALLRKAALAMHAGGVGYYPGSDFIHLDTGRIRQWG